MFDIYLQAQEDDLKKKKKRKWETNRNKHTYVPSKVRVESMLKFLILQFC